MSMFIEVSEARIINKRSIVSKGRAIMKRLNDEIKYHNDEYIVIDVESGDYTTDKNSLKARERMQLRHPNKVFYGARIGYPAVFKFS